MKAGAPPSHGGPSRARWALDVPEQEVAVLCAKAWWHASVSSMMRCLTVLGQAQKFLATRIKALYCGRIPHPMLP